MFFHFFFRFSLTIYGIARYSNHLRREHCCLSRRILLKYAKVLLIFSHVLLIKVLVIKFLYYWYALFIPFALTDKPVQTIFHQENSPKLLEIRPKSDGEKEGGYPINCGRLYESLNSNLKKMVKIHEIRLIANAQYVSLPESIISNFNHLRSIITSNFDGEGVG